MNLKQVRKIFYSSSACIYPERNQQNPNSPDLSEASAYPAAPDSEYGWEKLFSERLYASYAKNYGIDVRIGRLHNVFGPEGVFIGGKEKAPAALCRKIILSDGTVEVWGPGTQTRSFMFIEDCIEGIQRLMASSFSAPVNIGSSKMIAINDLARLIAKLAGKSVTIKNVDGPQGVMGRVSDNSLIQQVLGWQPPDSLEKGLVQTYKWIEQQLHVQA